MLTNFAYMIQRGCGDITRGGGYDCENPLQGGTKPKVIVFNKGDIASYTLSTTVPGLVTGITLKSGKSGYIFEGFKNGFTPSFEKLSSTSGQPLYKHIVDFYVYENTQLQKNNLEKLAAGKVVIIIENLKEDSNSFEIFGIGNGVELADGVINNKQENNGAYHLVMSTAENQGEGKMPQTFLSTDYSGTVTALATLCFLPTITTISDLTVAAAGGDAETITGTNYHGSGSTSDVASVKWINQVTGAKTTQTGVTVVSATSITFNTVALAAGSYKLEITTSKGVVVSDQVVVSA